jgi:hypothetical protein
MQSPSKKRLLSQSEGKKEVFSFDQHDNTVTIEHQEDVEPLIKVAKDMSEIQPSKDLRHTAVIPQFVLDQSLREKWTNKDWKKWANDSHNAMFRTWKGRL